MKIVILDASAANPGDISWQSIEAWGDLTVYDVTTFDQIVERTKDADVALTNKTPFTREILNQLPKLKYIGVLATGYNVVDLEACRERGIVVTNVPEYGTYATMQHTIALLLELTNHVALHNQAVMNGEWITSPQFCFWKSPLTELYGKTMVVVGYGKIGQKVATAAMALGLNVIAVPHNITKDSDGDIRFMTLEDALPLADIISLHAPLTSDTQGLICKNTLSKCKDGVLVINAARGGMVVEQDIRDALVSGKIGGYAADVVATEPMLQNNPLLGAPNCILTPHIAWAPKQTRERLIDVASENIRAFLEGNPVNTVT